MDKRIKDLAKLLVDYSTEVKKGDKVLVEAYNPATYPIVSEIIKLVYERGGLPFYRLHEDRVNHSFLSGISEAQGEILAGVDRSLMEQMNCFIGVRGVMNAFENSDVKADNMKSYSKTVLQKVHFEVRVPKTRWVILRWPTPSFAQSAKMNSEAFEDFFFDACLVDYAEMSRAMDPLVALMEKTDMVKITSPGTNLEFSMKDIPVVKCDGHRNIPDGEVYTAPVKDSVNGTIKYNTATLYEGQLFDGVELKFKNGKIIEANCDVGSVERLNSIFDRDEGARYVGEFAIGVNPKIKNAILDTLFDEKIGGSFHFTPGSSYDEAPNGNKSVVHWDMVVRQLEEFGGGEMYFDGKLIRKNGIFVLDELKGLNPNF